MRKTTLGWGLCLLLVSMMLSAPTAQAQPQQGSCWFRPGELNSTQTSFAIYANPSACQQYLAAHPSCTYATFNYAPYDAPDWATARPRPPRRGNFYTNIYQNCNAAPPSPIATCNITIPSTVNLGEVNTRQISAVGDLSPVRPVNIGMACSAPLTSIAVLFQPQTAMSGTACTGVMQSSGSAAGMGIKLTDKNNNAVCWGQKKAYTYDSLGSNKYNIPFQVAMIRVGSRVSVGSVRGGIVTTIDYK